MNKAIQKTNGKKTETLGVGMMLFQAFLLLFPDTLSIDQENAVELILGSGVIGTLSHRIWRNRKEIGDYIKKTIKSLRGDKNN